MGSLWKSKGIIAELGGGDTNVGTFDADGSPNERLAGFRGADVTGNRGLAWADRGGPFANIIEPFFGRFCFFVFLRVQVVQQAGVVLMFTSSLTAIEKVVRQLGLDFALLDNIDFLISVDGVVIISALDNFIQDFT